MVVKALGRHVCPLCGFQSGTVHNLVRHLVLSCLPKGRCRPKKGQLYSCWCGFECNYAHGSHWRGHFKKHGGVAAHYLAHRMGPADAAF